MSILLLFFALFLFYLIWRLFVPSPRVAVLLGLVTLHTILAAITEILSLLKAVAFQQILVSWVVICLACSVVVLRNKRALIISLAEDFRKLKSIFSLQVTKQERFLAYALLAVVLLTGLSGILYEPNSSDSLQYHLSRVSHWIQNRDIEFFPTTTIRELVMSPGSGFAMLHLILLGGTDRLAFLVQWSSMLGGLVAASLLARRLGANFTGQILAAVISATIPVGILEASGTLNDYFISFWILCLAFFSLEVMSGENRFFNQLGLGGSLGLAILAKSTAYIYALPILVWIVSHLVFRRRKELLSGLALAGLLALLINAGPYRRNYSLFGNILGSPDETRLYTNEIYSPTAVLSNIIRNVSLHLNTPVANFNDSIEQGVTGLHSLLQIDVNDPRTTYLAHNYDFQYRLSTATRQEIYAGNTLHLIFAGFSSITFLFGARSFSAERRQFLFQYMWVGLSMFALFCIVLKWQPFHSRQHLAFFLYFSPFIAVVFANALRPSILYALAYGVLVLALPWILFNSSRPLVPTYLIKQLLITNQDSLPDVPVDPVSLYGVFSDKDIQLFREMEVLREPLVMAMDYLASSACRDYGLIEGANTYQVEYPVWKLLERNFGDRFRLKHAMVTNGTEVAGSNHPDFEPCVVISFSTLLEDRINIEGAFYRKEFSASNAKDGSCCTVSLYGKDE